MTAETPQIPQSLHGSLTAWGQSSHRIAEIDAELGRLDGVMADLQRQLTEASRYHADLGRQRKAALDDVEFDRDMVEHGCARLGIEMPAQPPSQPGRDAAWFAPGDPPPPAPAGDTTAFIEVPSGVDALHALGAAVAGQATTETRTDPPPDTGGDQPAAEPGFQPEPDADTRRRRGGRRG